MCAAAGIATANPPAPGSIFPSSRTTTSVPSVIAKPPVVLLIDDSRMVRASIARHPKDVYEVQEAADGEEGWKKLLASPRVKVVISGLSMPNLDGYQLLERIRTSKVSRIREVPVMMISGSEEESERKRAADLGATDFITKGIGTAEVLARIDALSGLARAKAELDATRVALAEQATTDTVTQTFTMGCMVKQGSAMFSYARRHKIPVAVMRLGLDEFEDLRKRVIAAGADAPAQPPRSLIPSLDEALAMIADGHGERLRPHARDLARAIYPLVRFCNDVFQSDHNQSAEVRVQCVIEQADKIGKGAQA